MDESVVAVATVSGEVEAEIVCGLLRSAGIECGHRVTEAIDSPLHGLSPDGPREIIVHADDAEAAREIVADTAA
jgi:hypothetical protein